MEDYNAEEITGKKSGFTDKIKNNIKNSSVYQRVSAGLTAGLSLAYELYWMSKFNEIEGIMGKGEDGKIYLSRGTESVDLTGGKYGMPTYEPLSGPRPRELTEVTGLDAGLYKIAVDPILAAGFMIGTVGLATVVAYWLGGKILPKKEKVEEIKPDISDILDKIEQPDISDIIDVPASGLEMEVDAK